MIIEQLIKRPVAVFMTALAFTILGLVSVFRIPSSLLPDIDIPEIAIQLSYPNASSENLESSVVKPLRGQLQQLSGLRSIETETRDGLAVLKLSFNYGTNIDYAFIETNEKIDGSLNFLPKDLERPKVIKASATDIPVLSLSVFQKQKSDETSFRQLSNFTENVIKKRIEQLPEIAIADINGITKSVISVSLDEEKTKSLGISPQEITTAINKNNIELGDLLIKNGIHQYHFRFSNPLHTIEDIKDIYISKNDHLLKLKDIATVSIENEQERGVVYYNDQRAINIAIIKKADSRIDDLESSLNTIISQFKKDYPTLEFQTSKDQTKLLKLSIQNLFQSLLLGSFLAVVIMFFFLEDLQSPIVIGLSVPLSLIISFLFLEWFGLTINIVSLSGLILGVGNMIDNSIIVIDNIAQKINNGEKLLESCSKGTEEIITPLLSSLLTNCMIFIPLIFLSGISGAIFLDQAIAVTVGLSASFIVSIFFIPVMYFFVKQIKFNYKPVLFIRGIEDWYEKGFYYFFENKKITFSIILSFLISGVLFSFLLPYEKIPKFSDDTVELRIDWNDNITLEENLRRVQLLNQFKSEIFLSEIGEKQYLLNTDQSSLSETTLFIKENNPQKIKKTTEKITKLLENHFPNATFAFSPQKNLFEYIFGSNNKELVANIYPKDGKEPNVEDYRLVSEKLNATNEKNPFLNQINIEVNFENLNLYNVSYNDLLDAIKTSFNQNEVDYLKASQQYLPIKITSTKTFYDTLESTFVDNANHEAIPLKNLINISNRTNFKTIYGDNTGTKLSFQLDSKNSVLMESLENKFADDPKWILKFTGNLFELKELKDEMLFVFLISIGLLYLIMASQFESLIQPLIILIEIPIDIGGALLFLYLFGQSINIMSLIGIIVMSGIIINDSIIKVHTINELRKEGLSVLDAIKKGGKMRLKPILMTALTSVLALIPVLFSNDMGNEMQQPLAYALIGGMIIGTFVSLYFVPYLYYLIYKD
ncbi:MAG TPA: efflux RND transporter permease subunit [Flavobacterium sp.]|uniref:efflux RND transporter permease subunit n=1 Tax=Flavobacterium sp. TaxID=239 RepID=UPI002C8689B1|nr:efflux RND transporter permease subunit [Flavobacterium sp.]HSD15092.1 efflux RND transporter permease subunit [Flavobacterium sp.]